MKYFFLLFSSLFSFFSVFSQTLEQHQWQDRVILLFANTNSDSFYIHQKEVLMKEKAGLIERNLVIYEIFSQGGIQPGGDLINEKNAENWRTYFSVQPRSFTFLLIGKDGGEKLRSETIVPVSSLFGLIDGMPMRRAEMRRKKGN